MPLALTKAQLAERALATAIYAGSSVVIVNFVDPAYPIYTVPWLKHLFIAWAGTTLVMEARFWRSWAATMLGLNGGKEPQSESDILKNP